MSRVVVMALGAIVCGAAGCGKEDPAPATVGDGLPMGAQAGTEAGDASRRAAGVNHRIEPAGGDRTIWIHGFPTVLPEGFSFTPASDPPNPTSGLLQCHAETKDEVMAVIAAIDAGYKNVIALAKKTGRREPALAASFLYELSNAAYTRRQELEDNP